MNAMTPRVVVTSTGVISPLGAGLESFACALYAGTIAASQNERFPGVTTAAIADFKPQKWLGDKGIRVLDRSARLLAVASLMALNDAGLSQASAETGDPGLGLVCGTCVGSVHSITSFDWSGVTEGPAYVNPMEFPNTVINSPAGHTAIRHKLRGVNSTVCAGLASGLHAIHYAAEFLRFGRARALLAGGVEELCEETVMGFRKNSGITQSGIARPFDVNRDGVVPGEGSAVWMLETEEDAERRGRRPWIEICGFGTSQDSHSICEFDIRGEGAQSAMEQALADSGIGPEDVGCIIASAGGSLCGDEMEARALSRTFGSQLSQIPVCAPKAAFGEPMGASGAFCAVIAGLALHEQRIPPTAGFETSDYPLRLSPEPIPFTGNYALVNAFSFDGNNASLVVQLWKN